MHSAEPSRDDLRLMRGKFCLDGKQVESGLSDGGLDVEEVHDVLGELIVFLRHLTVN